MVYVYINDNNNNFDSSETNQSINCFHSFIHLNKCIDDIVLFEIAVILYRDNVIDAEFFRIVLFFIVFILMLFKIFLLKVVQLLRNL